MGIFSRILGLCKTKPPADPACWKFMDGKIEVDIARAPELKPRGGAVRLEGKGLPVRVLVFQGDDGGYHAVHNKCTHMGRRLDPLPGQTELECCSVNKSRFGYGGDKLNGPAKGAVTVFPVDRVDGKIVVALK